MATASPASPTESGSHEHDQVMLGRFGWKAGNPTLHQQNSDAMAGDIGISNPLFSNVSFGDCTPRQRPPAVEARQMRASERHGGLRDRRRGHGKEFCSIRRNLAVPARRDIDDPTVLHGKQMFYESGCIACHTPKFITPKEGVPDAQAFQLIWPYTDLLLHDMGEGLADHRPEGDADGREWRTPSPLGNRPDR